MSYELLESSVIPKSLSGTVSEDVLCIGTAYVAVIDGATSKTDRRIAGMTEGFAAAQAIASCLERLEAGLTGPALVGRLTARVRSTFGGVGRSGAAIAVLSLTTRTVTRVGNVAVRINGVGDPPITQIDAVTSAARAAYTLALLEGGAAAADIAKRDPGRQLVMPILATQHAFQNNQGSIYGYGSIDGSPVPDRFVEEFQIAPADELVLATDGYPQVADTLAETEALLATDLAQDPLRVGPHPATKGFNADHQVSYDDRAYLRLRLLA